MVDRKIDLLVLPGNFPQDPGDMSGIFILDYLRAVSAFCNVVVFDYRLCGRHTQLREEVIDGVRVLRLATTRRAPGPLLKRFLYLVWFYKGWRAARRLPPVDLIHAHGSTLMGSFALLVRRVTGAPIVMTHHSGSFNRVMRNRVSRWFTKTAFERCDTTLFVSRALERDVRKAGIAPTNSEVTGNPVDTELFDLSPDTALADRRSIIFIGRLEPFKGALRSVRAFKRIISRHPDWRLTIVGDGPERASITALVEQDPQLTSRVNLAGQLSKADIAAAIKHAAFLVSPSERETFGIVVAEAMAAGLPVIIGDQAGPVEFVDDSSGIRVAADSVEQIADAMERLINDCDRFQPAVIRAGIVARFSFDVFGARLRRVYEALL